MTENSYSSSLIPKIRGASIGELAVVEAVEGGGVEGLGANRGSMNEVVLSLQTE
jgi:hypothetical protein